VSDGVTLKPMPDPAFWYGIPHGYLSLDLAPPAEHLEALVEQVRDLPGPLREQAEQVLRFYASFVISMNGQHVQACLVGMHPDEDGGYPLSVLTVSTFPTNGINAEMAVASMAGLGGEEHPKDAIVPLELPCGLGFLAARTLRTKAPGRAPKGDGVSPTGTLWQGTVGVAEADRSSVILLQMVTPAVERAEDYRDILIGVAHTVTFTDPYGNKSGTGVGFGSGLQGGGAQAIRDDFG
jgi:hypothetical protein